MNKRLFLAVISSLMALTFSKVAGACCSGETLTTKVPFRATGSIENEMMQLKLDLGSGQLRIGNLVFNDTKITMEKNNLVFTGEKGTNIKAVLYVQNAGLSIDFECPGVNLPKITNARLILTSTDDEGKQTLLNDNCLFLDEAP